MLSPGVSMQGRLGVGMGFTLNGICIGFFVEMLFILIFGEVLALFF
jgi:hypothetical protein